MKHVISPRFCLLLFVCGLLISLTHNANATVPWETINAVAPDAPHTALWRDFTDFIQDMDPTPDGYIYLTLWQDGGNAVPWDFAPFYHAQGRTYIYRAPAHLAPHEYATAWQQVLRFASNSEAGKVNLTKRGEAFIGPNFASRFTIGGSHDWSLMSYYTSDLRGNPFIRTTHNDAPDYIYAPGNKHPYAVAHIAGFAQFTDPHDYVAITISAHETGDSIANIEGRMVNDETTWGPGIGQSTFARKTTDGQYKAWSRGVPHNNNVYIWKGPSNNTTNDGVWVVENVLNLTDTNAIAHAIANAYNLIPVSQMGIYSENPDAWHTADPVGIAIFSAEENYLPHDILVISMNTDGGRILVFNLDDPDLGPIDFYGDQNIMPSHADPQRLQLGKAGQYLFVLKGTDAASRTLYRLNMGGDIPFIHVDITTPDTTVPTDVTTYTISGTSTTHVISLWWTNLLTGAHGILSPASETWNIGDMPLGLGANVVRVYGTNIYGYMARDSVHVMRSHGYTPPHIPGFIRSRGWHPGTHPTDQSYVAIAAGLYASVALRHDGHLVTWGDEQEVDLAPPEGNDFIAVAAGERHMVALRENGSLVAWGDNDYWQTDVPPGSDFIAIDAGGNNGIALRGNGSIAQWGSLRFWAPPPPGNDFAAVAAGKYHFLALRNDGSLVSWGNLNADYGQTNCPPGNDFIAVSVGDYFSVALRTDGSIDAWGINFSGESNPPTGTHFVAISAGSYDAMALRRDGTIARWGSTGMSQFDGTQYVSISTYGVAYAIQLPAGYYTPRISFTQNYAEVTYDVESFTAIGTCNVNVMGGMSWENDRGGSGTLPAATLWTIPDIPLAIGTNTITITGTNYVEAVAQASMIIVRGDIGTGIPHVAITNTSPLFVPLASDTHTFAGTNNLHVVGDMSWHTTHGASGNIPATMSWTCHDVPLAIGINVFTITGTNVFGHAAQDTLTCVRGMGELAPHIAITSLPTFVSHDVTTYTVAGTNSIHVVDTITWSNAHGSAGSQSIDTPWVTDWTISNIPLHVGANLITVSGTNSLDEMTEDSITITRGEGGTGTPFVKITDAPDFVPYQSITCTISGTNNVNVVGGMSWENDRGGEGFFAADAIWTITDIPLAVGPNLITVFGTNMYGAMTNDSFVVTRHRKPGSLVAWGRNNHEQTNCPPGNAFIAIAAGSSHSLALREDGSVVGWGHDGFGQATVHTGYLYRAIAAADRYSVAVRNDGFLQEWGLVQDASGPPHGHDFTAVAAAYAHSIALRENGTVIAWGLNNFGQTNAPTDNGYHAVAAGNFHSLALREDGTIVGWGANNYGQINVPTNAYFTALAAGSYHSLALRDDGSLVGWGRNMEGQIVCPPGTHFVAVAAHANYSLALRDDGTLIGWGVAPNGQLNYPQGDDFFAIAAGNSHAVALQYPQGYNAPTIAVTQAPHFVTHDIRTTSIAGVHNEHVVGDIIWHNDRGGDGLTPATLPWTINDIPLAVGTNLITLTATNVFGESAHAHVTILRGDVATGVPMVTITNTTPVQLPHTIATYTLAGTNNMYVVGGMAWHNSLGGSGLQNADAAWIITDIPMEIGVNVITVTVTNGIGTVGYDTAIITRGAGEFEPAVSITTPSATVRYSVTDYAVAGTNNIHVVGNMHWENSVGGSGYFPAPPPWIAAWNIDNISLHIGDNTITVSGTNRHGVTAHDTVQIYRQTHEESLPYIATNALIFPAPESVLDAGYLTSIVWYVNGIYDTFDGTNLTIAQIAAHHAEDISLTWHITNSIRNLDGSFEWLVPDELIDVENEYVISFDVTNSDHFTNTVVFYSNPFTIVPEPMVIGLLLLGVCAFIRTRMRE